MARIEGIEPKANIVLDASGIQEGSQDVGPRSDPTEDRCTRTEGSLDGRPRRMAAGPESGGSPPPANAVNAAHGGASRMSVLN